MKGWKYYLILTLLPVAVDMKAPVQSHHPDILLARCWHDWLFTHRAPGSKPPVEILNTMNLIGCIDCEGNTIQTFSADHACEAVGVVGFTWKLGDRVNF